MNFGKLDRRITFESPPTGKDNGGELSGSWGFEFSCWANVKTQASVEAVQEGTEAVTDTLIFTIRYRSTITSDMRILYNSQYYQIVSNPVELRRNEYLQITAIHKTNW